jgi:ankyrin repeat protein
MAAHNIEVLRFLLDHGADLNARNQDGETALTLSAFSGQVDMVKELFRRGAVFDCKNETDRATLSTAEQRGYVRIVSALKKNGSNCDRPEHP